MKSYQNIRGTARKEFRRYRKRWDECSSCPLCEGRSQVVHFRGDLPALVTFIGEAPGISEDVIGVPFVGESGRLLQKMIREVKRSSWKSSRKFSFNLTNLVGCLPVVDETIIVPKAVHVKACSPHLREFLNISKPRLIVRVGKSAEKFETEIPVINIVHPSFILRQEQPSKAEIAYKRSIMTMERAFLKLSKEIEDV